MTEFLAECLLVAVGLAILLVAVLATPLEATSSVGWLARTAGSDNRTSAQTRWKVAVFNTDRGGRSATLHRCYGYSEQLEFVDGDSSLVIDDRTIGLVLCGWGANILQDPTLTQFPPQRLVGLSLEPDDFLNLSAQQITFVAQRFLLFCVGNMKNHPERPSPPFRSHTSFMYHDTVRWPQTQWSQRPRILSLVCSQKTLLPGHRYRHALCREILKRGLDIDLYGNGPLELVNGPHPNVKGHFEGQDLPYRNYRFHIAIENCEEPDYISEKFIQPVLKGCVPVYWGATRIEQYFGAQCCHRLSGDLETDLSLLQNILARPDDYFLSNTPALRQLENGPANLIHFLETTVLPQLAPSR